MNRRGVAGLVAPDAGRDSPAARGVHRTCSNSAVDSATAHHPLNHWAALVLEVKVGVASAPLIQNSTLFSL